MALSLTLCHFGKAKPVKVLNPQNSFYSREVEKDEEKKFPLENGTRQVGRCCHQDQDLYNHSI